VCALLDVANALQSASVILATETEKKVVSWRLDRSRLEEEWAQYDFERYRRLRAASADHTPDALGASGVLRCSPQSRQRHVRICSNNDDRNPNQYIETTGANAIKPAASSHGAALYYVISDAGANTVVGKTEMREAGTFICEPGGAGFNVTLKRASSV